MSSLCRSVCLLLLFYWAATFANAAPLRICADPDNLPFSNSSQQGFDNHIAVVIAHDLGRPPVFVWARSRRGFLREQFNKNACDMLMGVPAGMKAVATSEPYYRSTYVFVTPARDHVQIASFTDPQLNHRRIGLQILEEDMSPPSLPLIRAGHAGQLVGFESFDGRESDIVRAVVDRRIGVAVVWGPVAGYYAARQHLPLMITPVSPVEDTAGIPMAFSLTVGIHKSDTDLLDRVNASIAKLQPQIRQILASYHVPVVSQRGAR